MVPDFYNIQRIYREGYNSSDQTNYGGGGESNGPSNGRVPANGPGNGQTQPLQSAIPSNGDLVNMEDESILLQAFRDKLVEEIEDLINDASADNQPYARKVLMDLRSIVEEA